MRRKVSFNLQMIFGSFLLLLLILFAMYEAQQADFYLRSNLIGTFLIFFIVIALSGLTGLIFLAMRNYLKGDMGETDVVNILYKLPKEYLHLTDVMIENRGNIDDVVIGPSGVWTIEVKNQSERIILLENIQNELKQAYAEKMSIQNYLARQGVIVNVGAVLVFANKNTRLKYGMTPQEGVYVIGKKWLTELLTSHPRSYLSPSQCLAIREQLVQYSSIIN